MSTAYGRSLQSNSSTSSDKLYGDLPKGPTPNLEKSYEDAAVPAEEVQLEKAGVRLASISNKALNQRIVNPC